MLNKSAAREILYIFLAISGAVMVFLNTRNYGPGITDDSLNYIYSGTHLYLLKGFYNYDSTVFINWPPVYSFIIFLVSGISSEIYSLITIFNIILYFFTVILIGKLAEYVFTVPAIKIIYAAALTFSFQFLYLYSRVWSETVFLTLIILITLLIVKNSDESRNKYILMLASLCLLTRYLGIFLIISYYIYEVISKPKSDNHKSIHWFRMLIFSALAILPSLIWLLRNKVISNNVTSLHFNSTESVFYNFYRLFYFSSSLFIPESVSPALRISFFALFLAVIIYLYIKHKNITGNNKFILLFTFVYICLLLLMSGILKFDNISYRFLIPIYFVLLIIIIYPIEYFIKNSEKKSVKILLWVLLTGILIFPVEKGFKHTIINFNNGVEGLHSKSWVESETIKYIKTYLYNQNIYSNSVAGIFANTGFITKRFSKVPGINSRDSGVVQVIFNKNLPEIDTIPDLTGTLSIKDSIIYFYDSYIIFRKN